MKIAELFVGLGIKGGDESKKQVQDVDKSLKGVVSTGLAVKAGLIAITYGLQRLMNKSSMAGASLNQFENSTGLSAKRLQQWQFAARQFNVESEEMTGSVKSVQDAITNMLMGKGAPEGFGVVANMVNVDPKRVRDTFYVLEKLQEFAKQVPADVSKSMMRSFGLSEGVIAAMRQGAFNETVFRKAPTYNDGQIKALRKLNVGWSNMGDRIEKSLGALNAKYGGQLLKDIGRISEKLLRLIDLLASLAEKIKLFKGVTMVFDGWVEIFQLINDSVDGLKKNLEPLFDFLNGDKKDGGNALKETGLNIGKSVLDFSTDSWGVAKIIGAEMNKAISGSSLQSKSLQTSNNANFNQTLNFSDSSDVDKIRYSVEKATKDAYRQMQSQRQVN